MYFDKLSDLGIKLTRRSGNEKCKCPQCSDGRKNKNDKPLSVNITTGEFNCHNCGWKGNVRSFERKRDTKKYEKPDANMLKNIQLKQQVEDWFLGRGISKKTLEKFMIFSKQEWMPQTQKEESCVCFPYFREGEMVNVKYRDGAKNFKMTKDAELIFYNLQSIGERKKVIITEGEIDCMSLYEAGFGVEPEVDQETGEVKNAPFCEFAVVSVPNGASKGNQRLDFLDNCADYFIGLHEIIIATDNDEAGKMLKDELIRRLGVERCSVVDYPPELIVTQSKGGTRACKDFNEVLCYFGKDAVYGAVMASKQIPVDGIYYLEDVYETMLSNFRKGIQLAPTTRFKEMDEYFRWKKGDITLVTGYGNHGKALDIRTPIPTIDGWKTMGELSVGDQIFDENGDVCHVTYATPIMYDRECFEVTFSDNTKVIADAEHLWVTHTEASRMSDKNKKRNGNILRPKGTNQEYKRIRPKIRTTKEILGSLYNYRKNGRRSNNHSIDNCKPIKTQEKNLLIHPYCLGAWLGDGTSCAASITSADVEIINLFNFYGYETKKRKQKYLYGVHSGFFNKLKDVGVLKNKHIPDIYLRSSISQRMDLLKGLMDTDGNIDKWGICEYTSVKKTLAEDVYELITSLGFKATFLEGDAKLNGNFISKKYRIIFKPNVCVFNLKRKAERHKDKCKNNWRYIKSIEPVESVPVRCITVDSPNRMYLCTKSFVPTHNTFFILQLMLTKSIWDGWKWAIFSPENFPPVDFYDDLIEMYVGKWLNNMTEYEYNLACMFIDQHIFYVYPDDEHDINSIHEKFRHLILKKGVDGVMIDPFNQLDSNQKAYQREDQYLSEVLKDVKRFALLNNVCYTIIAHPKNPTYEKDKSLPIVDMYDIAGGAMWGNKADQIISYYRPNFHIDKNSTDVQVYIQKLKRKRTGGKLGDFPLKLNWARKRYMNPVTGEEPCDPLLCEKTKAREQNDFVQPRLEGWTADESFQI